MNTILVKIMEKDACRIITSHFEPMLVNRNKKKDTNATTASTTSTTCELTTEQELVRLGHFLQSLAFLNIGNDVETVIS